LDKELRKELRRDELAEALGGARSFFATSSAAKPALAVTLLFLALWALYAAQQYRAARAESAFTKAAQFFSAPVNPTALAKDLESFRAFKTAREKYEKALGEFDAVASSYGSQPASRRARYYAALCRLELGGLGDAADAAEVTKAEEALKTIGAIRDASALEPALARLTLAERALRAGRAAEAVTAFENLVNDAGSGVPKDRALFGLGEAFDAAGQRDKAKNAYQDLANKFPESPYAAEARAKAGAIVL
jgi:tetratricopeptide (TPR) repeat protein